MAVQPFVFGPGIVWPVPLTDVNGNAISNPTPQRFLIQEFSLDWDLPLKELNSLYVFPIATARGAGKITGKVKFANINIGQLNSVFFGEPSAPVAGGANQVVPINDEKVSPITGGTYTVANAASISSGNPMTDLGVRYGGSGATAGQFLTRVASAPTQGTYSVNLTTGVYTFNSADNGSIALIDYAYSPNSSTNQSVLVQNHLIGSSPTFQLIGKGVFPGTSLKIAFQLNQVIANKLSQPWKLNDWLMQELDFGAFADGGNNIGIITGPYY